MVVKRLMVNGWTVVQTLKKTGKQELLTLTVKTNHDCTSLTRGTDQNPLAISITENHLCSGLINQKIVVGSATRGVSLSMYWFATL